MELLLEDEAAAEVFAAPAAGGAGGGERVHVLLPSDVCGGTPLCCPGCGRAFKNAQNLALHARSHPPGLALPRAPPPRRGRFHCCEPACPYAPGRKSLADFKSATKHYAQKHADKTLSCAHPGCTARFAKAHQLNRHRKNAHGSTTCRCGVAFANKHALTLHARQWGNTDYAHAHGPAGADAAPRAAAPLDAALDALA